MQINNLITSLKRNKGRILSAFGGGLLGIIAPLPVMAIVYCADMSSFVFLSVPCFVVLYVFIDLLIWQFLRQINRVSAFWYVLLNILMSAYWLWGLFS